MKKLSSFLAIIFLSLLAVPRYAAIEVTCFEGLFKRCNGAPVIKSPFRGISDLATVRLLNGPDGTYLATPSI